MVKNLQEKNSSKESLLRITEISNEKSDGNSLETISKEIEDSNLINWMKSNIVQPSNDVVEYIMKKIK